MSKLCFRGALFHTLGNPVHNADAAAYYADGGLIVEHGKVLKAGAWDDLQSATIGLPITHLPDTLIVPGFIDAHVHYPQVDAIGGFGEHLLDWLKNYAFPAEMAFADMHHARKMAKFFLSELLRNGTTSALVFATVHPHSVDALFEEALARNMRLITGKVLMDRNAPDELLDSAQDGYVQSKALIEKWAGKGRLGYAVTPRFAPTSTREQLDAAGKLLAEFPDILMHTHLCENKKEIEWVSALFPEARDYLDVYARAGLVNDRSVFAHCVHLTAKERADLGTANSAIAFCPMSNMFLGSGCFDLAAAQEADIEVGFGSDVGAGTSLSSFGSMNEGYKTAQLKGQRLHPFQAFYMATLGGARALHIDHHVGNFTAGKEADFCLLDMAATPLLKRRLSVSKNAEETLFALSMLGDDRAIRRTYVAGQLAHDRDTE